MAASPNETTPLCVNGSDEESAGQDDFLSVSLIGSMRQISEHISRHMGRIGWLGSMSIAVNSLTGPAMVNLPDTFQRCGLIPTTLCIVVLCALSSQCCLHMSNTISKVPGNRNFKCEVRNKHLCRVACTHRN